MMKLAKLAGLLIFLIVFTACGSGNTGGAAIEVQGAWARAATAMGEGGHGAMATPAADMEGMGANSAAYMLLRNNGSTADRLLRAESDVAQAVELHVSEMKGEVMTMRPIEFVEVPAGGEAELKPGGMHVMLIGLKRNLMAGESITLVLIFENAGRVSVKADIRAP